ncbi:MAG: trypsin-like peptidase domain-containing protein [Nocardiopsaceae bacterium]|nr:trypsin-like peptidase domain-containing protein [Nocardiopsaceae bacterium]
MGRRSHARRGFALVFIGILAVIAVNACSSAKHDAAHSKVTLQQHYESTITKALPSVVEIQAGHASGSGVVLDRRGHIVTNAHVVGTEKKFVVRISLNSKPMKAWLVGEFTPDDLAVIKVGKGSGALRPAQWADSADARLGAIVLAVGSPLGLTDSVTQGIVSGTGRLVTGPPIPGHPPAVITDAVQTSAAINPGNSGGALMLLSGHVLGIPTLTAHDPTMGNRAEGIGFAIPSNTVLNISNQLIKNGKVTKSDRASLDIKGETHVNSSHKPDGVTVVTATPGGAAAKARIKPSDVIVGIGGRATPDVGVLDNSLIGFRPGEHIKVEVLRDGNPRQLMVTLGSLGS